MAEQKPRETAIREGDPPNSGKSRDCDHGHVAESTIVVPPVGRSRRYTGIALLVLGLVVVARVLWLGAFFRQGFGDVEWVRFYGLLAIGTWLGLLGYWLAFRSRVALLVLVLTFGATLLAGVVHDVLLR
jgi:hypothetical protein